MFIKKKAKPTNKLIGSNMLSQCILKPPYQRDCLTLVKDSTFHNLQIKNFLQREVQHTKLTNQTLANKSKKL